LLPNAPEFTYDGIIRATVVAIVVILILQHIISGKNHKNLKLFAPFNWEQKRKITFISLR